MGGFFLAFSHARVCKDNWPINDGGGSEGDTMAESMVEEELRWGESWVSGIP